MKHRSIKSKFTVLENRFLNTFFSGIYFSPHDFIRIGNALGLSLEMHTREMLIKRLLNESETHGNLPQAVTLLCQLIDERIAKYHQLSMQYPGARQPLASLAQKANATKALLAQQHRGDPYE